MELYPGWTLNRFLIFNHTAQFDLNKIYTKTASKFKWAHGPYRDTQYKPFLSLFGNTSGHSVFKLKSNIFILEMTKVLTFLQKNPTSLISHVKVVHSDTQSVQTHSLCLSPCLAFQSNFHSWHHGSAYLPIFVSVPEWVICKAMFTSTL